MKLALKLDHVVPKPVKLELQNVNIFVKKRNYYMFSFSGREAGLEVGLILAKNREVGTSKCEYIQEKRNHGSVFISSARPNFLKMHEICKKTCKNGSILLLYQVFYRKCIC